MPLKYSGKPGRPSTKETKRRRRAVARNLANGMGKVEALVKAGYARNHAEVAGYRIIKHPEIQSRLTEAVARALAREKLEFDAIVQPYVRALKAKVIIKNAQTMTAVETELPDHAIRMDAATHLTKLYQPKQVDEQAESEQSGPPVLYQINFIGAGQSASPVIVPNSQPPPPEPEGAPPPVPRVTFVRGKR